MNIYLAHSRDFDFRKELYTPIRKGDLFGGHNLVLPHEFSEEPFDSKTFISSKCDLLIAEVSLPSIGLGIELGWASIKEIPIICLYKKGQKVSNSLKVLSGNIIEYTNIHDVLGKIQIEIANHN